MMILSNGDPYSFSAGDGTGCGRGRTDDDDDSFSGSIFRRGRGSGVIFGWEDGYGYGVADKVECSFHGFGYGCGSVHTWNLTELDQNGRAGIGYDLQGFVVLSKERIEELIKETV